MRRRAVAIALVALFVLAAPAAALAQQCPRTTLGDIEDEVMCPRCGRPLNTVDREPQATRERAFIQRLIDQCRTKGEIKAALESQFGPEVLAVPESKGFDATAFIVPVVVPLVALGAIAVVAAGWRRRRPDDDGPSADDASPALDPGDSARLDQDLERYKL